MTHFFKLPVLVEPDRLRFIRFANEAVTGLGGSAFASAPRMEQLLLLLRDYCGRTDGVVDAGLVLDGKQILACCGDHRLLLSDLPKEPDRAALDAFAERLRERSESADPELLKRRNQQIKEDLDEFIAESSRQKAEIEAELDRKKVELQRSIRLAETDSLTGLFNRGAFDRRMEEALSRAQRQNEPLALMLLDLDKFKQVNDQHGHQFGDAYLRRFADALRQAARKGVDQLFRIGGDEFAAIVFAPASVALRVGSDVLELMDRKVSVGVAALQPGDTAAQLIARADAALYRAKGAGRGQVCCDGNGEANPPRVAEVRRGKTVAG